MTVPFTGGRGDASQDWTDAESFEVMEPAADGFRNYLKTKHSVKTEELLLDRAPLLGLSAPEMTVLVGGLRVLGANYRDAPEGVFTNRKGQLTNDFFVNLLDNDTFWEVVDDSGDEEFIGYDRGGKQEKWRATRTDLIFGSNSQLRATRRGLCREGQRGEVRPRLHQGLDQGDERRSLRSRRQVRDHCQRSRAGAGESRTNPCSGQAQAGSSAGASIATAASSGTRSLAIRRSTSASILNSPSRGLERRQISAIRRKGCRI